MAEPFRALRRQSRRVAISNVLELVHLSRRFGGTLAVADANLRIEAGEMTGIIGRSGAGKSTLLRLINRLIDPTGGAILSGGIDVARLRGWALREWRARNAMIFQQFNLDNRLDVLTNVLTGSLIRMPLPRMLARWFTRAEREEALVLLDRFGLFDVAMNRAGDLSGGQQQRVAIARAYAAAQNAAGGRTDRIARSNEREAGDGHAGGPQSPRRRRMAGV